MHDDARMQRSKSKKARKDTAKSARITVSLPRESYETVVRMAKNKRVSTSWVVRDAVETYLAADMPLFAQQPNATI
jgi:metal-responsive CopG/Arc/MetJ family transcriptional regulator